MSATFPSYTKTWHSSSYDAINPTRPENSAQGKVVVITGGSGTIGTAIARSFAQAGAAAIILTGRTKSTLEVAKASVQEHCPGSNVAFYISDVADSDSTKKTMDEIHHRYGPIHVLVNNAGYFPSPTAVAAVDPVDWWKSFEVNVRGTMNAIQSFLPHAASEGPALINISAGTSHTPPFAGWSGYTCAKVASAKLLEHVQLENPSLHVMNVHPGVVESLMTRTVGKSGQDDAQLPADFVVWTTSAAAKFLKGKYVWANWDVQELMEQSKEIQEGHLLTIGLNGLPRTGQ